MTDSRAQGNVQADVPRLAWSVREFAAALGLNMHTVYRAINRGELAAFRICESAEWRIPNAELERLLSEAYERAAS